MKIPLQMLGNMPIGQITKQKINEVMNHLLTQQVKPVTVRNRMSVLRTVLRWCADQEYCDTIPFPKLPPAHYEKFIPPTPEELLNIFAVAAPHIQRVVILGAQLGVRVGASEMLQLTWEDVDLVQGIVRVHGAKKNLQQPWHEVPLRENLLSIFKLWNNDDKGEGFLIHFQGKQVKSIKTAWRATLRRAGITSTL